MVNIIQVAPKLGINVRFRNHMFHGTGNSNTKKAIKKYGLENFKFIILEYYPSIT